MKRNDCIIRKEKSGDYSGIREINHRAFENGENEAKLVELIRASEHYHPDLSLVAVKDDGEVIGHILFSIINLVTEQGTVPTLGLAPMAVKPDYQNSGIGSDLVNKGIKTCKALGYQHIFVLDHPNFYPRFGFSPASQFGIDSPFPVPDEVFMALELKTGSLYGLQGKIEYPPAFNAVS
ncbi:N-acetyltransferase [Mesobacillus subterraneus]|uniref:GNAT family N-acetyltransferase n=1 Tax=Mesobacillus subterraneus TaxID=285983 RepID=UPI00273FA7D1|nr:N-acetyltransferase [Mesobacillus subterraneus]WLR57522.1 N-acetyltransferase [Mesobacillus subterraneus]